MHRACFSRWRAAEQGAMQCHESFRGARLRRSNQKRGNQADEHGRNQCRIKEHWSVPNDLILFILEKLSVCGRRAGTVERRRRDGQNGVGVKRRRRAADGNPPPLRLKRMPLVVTRARFAWKRSDANRALVTASKRVCFLSFTQLKYELLDFPLNALYYMRRLGEK